MGDAVFHVIVKTQTRRNLRRYLRFGFRIQTNKSKFRRLFHVVLRFLVSTSALFPGRSSMWRQLAFKTDEAIDKRSLGNFFIINEYFCSVAEFFYYKKKKKKGKKEKKRGGEGGEEGRDQIKWSCNAAITSNFSARNPNAILYSNSANLNSPLLVPQGQIEAFWFSGFRYCKMQGTGRHYLIFSLLLLYSCIQCTGRFMLGT